MSNFQQSFNEECRRLARKEVKTGLEPLTKAVSELRKTVAECRKQIKEMQARMDKGCQVEVKPKPVAAPVAEKNFRLTPARIRKMREKIGLTCRQFAKLLEVSYISVLHWESGKAKPRREQLQKIAQIRDFGKRELKAALDAKGLAVRPAKPAETAKTVASPTQN